MLPLCGFIFGNFREDHITQKPETESERGTAEQSRNCCRYRNSISSRKRTCIGKVAETGTVAEVGLVIESRINNLI